jgi:hypothetical protein
MAVFTGRVSTVFSTVPWAHSPDYTQDPVNKPLKGIKGGCALIS